MGCFGEQINAPTVELKPEGVFDASITSLSQALFRVQTLCLYRTAALLPPAYFLVLNCHFTRPVSDRHLINDAHSLYQISTL